MFVKNIHWIDQESLEAEVVISDGKYECLAFSHPCRLRVGDEVLDPLHSFEEGLVYRVNDKETTIVRTKSTRYWAHEIVALVIDAKSKLVKVGNIRIVLGSLPGDIVNGDLVEFCSDRLDV